MTWLFFWLTDDAVTGNYVPQVSVQMAYAITTKQDALPDPVEGKPDPNCPQCKGTGQIKTGDKISWTKCDCLFREQQPEPPSNPEPPPLRAIPRRSH